MVSDVTETLRQLLDVPSDPALATLANAQISLEQPSDSHNSANDTVNLYLYDLQEDGDRREVQNREVRGSASSRILPPPLRMIGRYLVTASAASNATGNAAALLEHELLGQALIVLARTPVITDPIRLSGALQPPLYLSVARGSACGQGPEFWSSVGARLRPSLRLDAAFGMALHESTEVAAVISRRLITGERTAAGEQQIDPHTRRDAYAIAGRVWDQHARPVPGALVSVDEAGDATKTDAQGQFLIAELPVQTDGQPRGYTLRVQLMGGSQHSRSITVPAPSGADYEVTVNVP